MFRTVIEGLAGGLRTYELAAATVAAIPLATLAHRWLPDRSVERLGVVVVPAVVAFLVVPKAFSALVHPTRAAAREAAPEGDRSPWLSAFAAALLCTVAVATREHEGSRAVMALAIALALLAAIRLGWSILPAHSFAMRSLAVASGVGASEGLATPPAGVAGAAPEHSTAVPRQSPPPPPSPSPGVVPPPVPEEILRTLRSCMDEVAYAPGDPNVLSMTKRLLPDADPAAAPARARCVRADDGPETVVQLAGVLDALEVPAIRVAFDRVVADRRASVSIDFSGLEFIDSSGVGAVVGLLKRCRAFGGTLRVIGARGQPLAVVRLLHLDRALGIE